MQAQRIRQFLALVAAGLVLGAGTALGQQEEEMAEIRSIPQRFMEAYNRGDLAAVAALYTDDARLHASTGQSAEGRGAIQELLGAVYGRGAVEIVIEPQELELAGDLAFAGGPYAYRTADGQTVAEGYSLLVLRRVDGEWRIYRHVSNRATPPG